jgi:integrase
MAPEGQRPKAGRVTEDCFAVLVRLFMSSSKWTAPEPQGYSKSTKETWRRELTRAMRPDCLGALSLQEIRPSLVQAYFDGMDGLPGKQRSALGALKQLEKWAVVRDLLPRPITTGVEIGRSDGGHIPWTDDQVALGESHAPADLARAITLAANIGQRGSDLVRMGPTDVETYKGVQGINVVQQKTKKRIWVPITAELAAQMTTWERRPGPFLFKADGSQWTRKSLSNAWTYARDNIAALAPLRIENLVLDAAWAPLKDTGLVMHGLRGTACVRLRRAGATVPQIADMVGMSEEMVARYCRFSVQRDNALAAVLHLERTFAERNPGVSNKNRGIKD